MNKLLSLVTVGFRSRALLRTALIATLGLLLWSTAQAEGSRSLYPAGIGGNRAAIEWRDSTYYNGPFRRTLLYVYAEAGEVLLLGSSNIGSGSGNIYVYEPGVVTGTPGEEVVPDPDLAANASIFRCSSQTDKGPIETRTEELAGPLPSTGGYDPCVYTVPTTGIYNVVMRGTNSNFFTNSQTNPGGVVDPSPGTFQANTSAIIAWDVTVRTTQNDPVTEQPGRVFTYAIGASMGANGRNLFSTIYTVTDDGFRYRTFLRGFDPFGFILIGNPLGFLDPDGTTPIYRDAVDDNSQLTSIDGGVTVAPAQYPIFFNPPADAALSGIGIPLATREPQLRNLEFAAPSGGRNTPVGQGGTFSYDAVNINAHNYQLVISRDGVNFDPTLATNRALRGRFTSGGPQSIVWNGEDNVGNDFPVAEDYPARIRIHAGEYHFPYGDVENAPNGGPTYELLNPPGGVCPPLNAGCFAAFYDDRGYRLSNGTTIGTVNQPLEASAPPIPYSGPDGFNTDSDQRRFGQNTTGGRFGDEKGLDLWTYYPSNASTLLFNVVDPTAGYLDLAKSVCNITQGCVYNSSASGSPGEILEYRIAYTNPGSSTGSVSDVEISDAISGFTPLLTGAYSGGTADIAIVCPDGSNTFVSGSDPTATTTATSITVDITTACGNITIAPGESGFIRFRVRID